jgi:hypothetical protein
MAKSSQLEGILSRATTTTPKAVTTAPAMPAEIVQLETSKPIPETRPAVEPKAAVGAKAREPQKSIQAFVPASVDRALRMKAAEEGTTTRNLILRGLKAIGFDVADEELRDKRGKS